MDRCVAPALNMASACGPSKDNGSQNIYLIVEPAPLVQEFKERRVSLASPEIKVTDLEIAPDCTTSQYPAELCSVMIWKRTVAVVVSLSVVIRDEGHRITRGNEIGMVSDKVCIGLPIRWCNAVQVVAD